MNAEFCMKDGRGVVFRGKYLGRLHMSEVHIEYNVNYITKLIIRKNELQEDMGYTEATSDYLQRGTGYSRLDNNINHKYNVQYLRDTL